MNFTIFHLLVFVILFVCFVLICVLIFLKVKQKEFALVCYCIALSMTSILIYSLFLTINQFTTQAELTKLTYTRDLRTESVIIQAKVTNLTSFKIRKCYLLLNILNKQQVGGEIFDSKNLKNADMKNTSINHTIEIVNNLAGNTSKDFIAKIPFPTNFSNPEFYHTLKCI